MPLFHELREHFFKLLEATPNGTEHVISKHRRGPTNLRTQRERIILRAGVCLQAKLHHNLWVRSRTKLKREYDLAKVCKWIGNSPAVAAKHYAMSVDLNADFDKAVGPIVQAHQTAASDACPGWKTKPPTNQKIPENKSFVNVSQTAAIAEITEGWARQDQNTPANSAEKPLVPPTGAVKCAAESAGCSFAAAVTAIMALPLTESEKAEAVRRLLSSSQKVEQ